MSRNLLCLSYFQTVKCYAICFLKTAAVFLWGTGISWQSVITDSKRLNDIKTVKLCMESGDITGEEAGGDRLCFPGLVKVQLLLPFFLPVTTDHMLLLSFTNLNLQVEKLYTIRNI